MRDTTRYAIITGVVLLMLIIGISVAAIFHILLDVLYIFLMFLAALLVTATFLQIYWVVMLIRTVRTVRDEMQPLLVSVEETVSIVKDTAKTAGNTVSNISTISHLTSEFVLGPGIRTAAALVALQQGLRVFLGKGKVLSRHEERRRQQLAAMESGAGGKT
jgi:hypothetical protein